MTPAETLVRSACSGDVSVARALLAADPALATADLACACVCGEPFAVADVRAPVGPLHWDPLLYACFTRLPREEPLRRAGVRRVAGALLAAGADPNTAFDHEGWLQVPVYGAAGILNDAPLLRLLLDAGADPNDDRAPHTVGEALYHAVEFADVECAALLVEAGTHPHVVDYCIGRALDFAAPEMTEMLCAQGAQATSEHLHHAVWKRRPLRTVQALLDAGAPVDEPDAHGRTPLAIAERWGSADVCVLLAARGASAVTATDRALGAYLAGDGPPAADAPDLEEMLDVAVCAGDVAAVRRLLDAGAALDTGPHDEGPPVGQAAWRGQAEVVAELIARGAALAWEDGSARGAAEHGSRHCHDPEGGPTMRTAGEIPQAPYERILELLAQAERA